MRWSCGELAANAVAAIFHAAKRVLFRGETVNARFFMERGGTA
jgi:hypothetical protein